MTVSLYVYDRNVTSRSGIRKNLYRKPAMYYGRGDATTMSPTCATTCCLPSRPYELWDWPESRRKLRFPEQLASLGILRAEPAVISRAYKIIRPRPESHGHSQSSRVGFIADKQAPWTSQGFGWDDIYLPPCASVSKEYITYRNLDCLMPITGRPAADGPVSQR